MNSTETVWRLLSCPDWEAVGTVDNGRQNTSLAKLAILLANTKSISGNGHREQSLEYFRELIIASCFVPGQVELLDPQPYWGSVSFGEIVDVLLRPQDTELDSSLLLKWNHNLSV